MSTRFTFTKDTAKKTVTVAGLIAIIGLVVGYIRRWQAAFARSRQTHPAKFDPFNSVIDAS